MRKRRKVDGKFEIAKKIIVEQTTLDEQSADAILRATMIAVKNEQSRYNRSAQDKKIAAAKRILENYNTLRLSISAGISNTADVIDDTEMQRLMQREDSVKNQQIRSLAMQSATNRVLFLQINSVLDEMRNVCRNDRSPRFRRQYDVLYSRYIRGWSIEAICTEFAIEKSECYRTIDNAIVTFAAILFGAITPEDFCASQYQDQAECIPADNTQPDSAVAADDSQLRFF